MQVRYLYSACVVIETSDVRVLCDPWFTPGAYDGSWFQWPVIDDPVAKIGPVDLIYISHIHPDHYDPTFLRLYLADYPRANIVIGRQSPPVLEQKLKIDGLPFQLIDALQVGSTSLHIIPNRGRVRNIDTALVVCQGGKSVVNLNDNPFDQGQVAAIQAICAKPTLALLPCSGATAHPQAYRFPSEAALREAAELKERHYLDIYHRYIQVLAPDAVLPFAGKYWLGGPLSALNRFRGIPDPVKAAQEAGPAAFVLADGGDATFDLDTMAASSVRTAPYDLAAADQFLAEMDFPGYAYEREIRPDPGHALPLERLLNAACRRARSEFPLPGPHWICVKPERDESFLCFDVAGTDDIVRLKADALAERCHPRLEVYIDPRYLFGLLTRLYNWSNASIGSQYFCKRAPDIFNRDIFYFIERMYV